MRRTNRHRAVLSLPSIRLEGGLFLPNQLEKAALGQAQHQTESDYRLPPGRGRKDEIGRAFQIAAAQWRQFEALLDRTDLDAGNSTEQFIIELLRHAFGYQQIARVSGVTVGERHYPVTALAGHLPVVIAPHRVALDEPRERFAVEGSGSRRKSAFQLAQECLNASQDHLWALVSNGRQIRLLRNAATLTRPSFLEIDLQDLLASQRYAEFTMAWRLLHASRADPDPDGSAPASAIWERWCEAGVEEGTRVREGLRVGVADALMTLGSGFLAHPGNQALRQALQDETLDKHAYFQQLLCLIYRLIFLFSVEERGLLHPADDSPAARRAREAYAEGYAMARLRDRCLKRRARNRDDDLWQATRIVFKGLADGEPRLALPALGGLFALTQCPDLDGADLDNAHWLSALAALRWSRHGGNLAPVDYRNMAPEELGSVYESLLELEPELDLPRRAFGFVGGEANGEWRIVNGGVSASSPFTTDHSPFAAFPTRKTLYLELRSDQHNQIHRKQRQAAQQACDAAQVFHWQLRFPQVFARSGFDCVLGNPPWEVSQMGEEEFFSARAPLIAALAGDERKRAILALETDDPPLWSKYVRVSQQVAASNAFFRHLADLNGRRPASSIPIRYLRI